MKILTRYILKEMIGPTALGFSFYTFIILMRQLFDFAAALRLAQERGFAEADATLDVSGADALQKMQILAELAFGAAHARVRVHGIVDIHREEVEQARSRRCVIRHVASARRLP
ncbi:MAG TPA: hypothetical protein VKL19_04395, partial [Thermoanaerobaculia bacterium]|nr:hypothetical protein [Thermoanaerobaculia bacterium]